LPDDIDISAEKESENTIYEDIPVQEHLSVVKVTEKTDVRNSLLINAPFISQWPELPTGCEVTSAAMLLNYYGFKADKYALSWDYLPIADPVFYFDDDGNYYGPDPYKYFIGDPEMFEGFGCYAPVIEGMLNKYLQDNSSKYRALDISGCNFDYLIKCLNEEKPVMVWANGNQMPLFESSNWITPSGISVNWLGNEHCMLLIGYDQNGLWFNDPLMEDAAYGIVVYDRDEFEYYWIMLGKQAVILTY
jgi:uncharacterized protein YvpB